MPSLFLAPEISLRLAGSGPLWDYAASANSSRRTCSQESRWPMLALTSNFVDIHGHCLVGGWYLSRDVQFLPAGVYLLRVMARASLRANNQPRPGSGCSSTKTKSQADTYTGAGATKRTRSGMKMVELQRQTAGQTQEDEFPYNTNSGNNNNNINNRHEVDNNMSTRPRRLMAAYGAILLLALRSALAGILSPQLALLQPLGLFLHSQISSPQDGQHSAVRESCI